jgi:pSer/pThr/pTyr-binding forkhead associated (FHA) protein
MSQIPTIYKIGRIPYNEFHIDHESVSRNHAEIFVDPEMNVFLSDTNSTNGTFVNGTRIQNPVILKRGDVVWVGNKQNIEWETKIFGSKITAQSSEKQSEKSDTAKKSENKELIIIYGSIVLMLILLSVVI